MHKFPEISQIKLNSIISYYFFEKWILPYLTYPENCNLFYDLRKKDLKNLLLLRKVQLFLFIN